MVRLPKSSVPFRASHLDSARGALLRTALWGVLTVGVPAAMLVPTTAHAQADGAPDSAVEEARHRMEKGREFFAEEKFAEAMAEFEAAYKVQPYKAFLYNAAVAAERAGDRERAVAWYKEFLGSEPNAPDAAQIRATIERLQKEDRAAPPSASSETRGDIRSVVIILSDPKGAPATIYERLIPTAPLFDPAKTEQPGWKVAAKGLITPIDLPLKVGTYHIEVEAYRDFNRSGTDLQLEAGTVYVFKSNLSQGSIVGKVQIKTPVAGAKVYVDDPLHRNAPLGTAPGTIDVVPGKHKLSIEAPGYEPWTIELEVEQGKMRELQVDLKPEKAGYLYLTADAEQYSVKIDGVKRGVQQRADGPFRLRLDEGPHDLVVDASGRHAYAARIEIPGGKELPIETKLNETGSKGGGVALAILSAGAIAGGATFWALAPKQKSEKNFHIASAGCFAGAGVFAGLSIFLFVWDPTDKSRAQISPARVRVEGSEDSAPLAPASPTPKKVSLLGPLMFAPVAAPGSGGVSVFGRF